MSIEPKSGCIARRRNIAPTIRKYGRNPSWKSERRERFLLIKNARYIRSPIFANSTGCTEGSPGISSHHFAPLYSSPIKSTDRSKKKHTQNIGFACCSRSLYGILVIITRAIMLINIDFMCRIR